MLTRPLRLAYGILVSEEIHNYMREVELEIALRFGDNPELRLPPHITLKQHATIAFGLRPEDFVTARETYAQRRVEFRFRLRTFGMFYRVGHNEWIVYKQASVP